MKYFRADNLRPQDKGWRVHPDGKLEVYNPSLQTWAHSTYRTIDEVAVEMALAGEVLYSYECC